MSSASKTIQAGTGLSIRDAQQNIRYTSYRQILGIHAFGGYDIGSAIFAYGL